MTAERFAQLTVRAALGLTTATAAALVALGIDFALDSSAANLVYAVFFALPALLSDLIALPLLWGARFALTARSANLYARIPGVRTRLTLVVVLLLLATAWCGLIVVSAAFAALAAPSPPSVFEIGLLVVVGALAAGQIYAAVQGFMARQLSSFPVSGDGRWWWDGSAWQPMNKP